MCELRSQITLCSRVYGFERPAAAIFGLRYSLDPDEPFNTKANTLLCCYKWLIEDQRVAPENILVPGESAGGGLALAFLTAFSMQKEDPNTSSVLILKPGYVFLMSAWFDLLGSNQRSVNPPIAELGIGRLLSVWGFRLLRNSTAIEKDIYGNFAAPSKRRDSWKEILPEYVWVSSGEKEQSFKFDVVDFVQHIRSEGVDAVLKI